MKKRSKVFEKRKIFNEDLKETTDPTGCKLTSDADALAMLCASDTWKVTCPFTMGWEVSSLTGACSDSCPGPSDDCEWLLACP